jgi:hypothetical protein
MSGKSRAFTEQVKQSALALVGNSGVNLLEQEVRILPLAKELMALTGCGIDTAKVKIARAARAIHGQVEAVSGWGGKRDNATGRPRKEVKRIINQAGQP